MHYVKLFVFVLGALAVTFAGAVSLGQAQEKGQQPKPRMQCKERFNLMDADQDGVVTLEEFEGFQHSRGDVEALFKSRDINGDGSLTEEEFCATRGMGKGKNQ